MNCAACRNEFEKGERVITTVRQTFIFKPADVPDTVNPAKVTEAELLESRKDHKRTTLANMFMTWGEAEPPADAFNFRHQACEVQRTGGSLTGAHALTKHSVRFSRGMSRRGSR